MAAFSSRATQEDSAASRLWPWRPGDERTTLFV